MEVKVWGTEDEDEATVQPERPERPQWPLGPGLMIIPVPKPQKLPLPPVWGDVPIYGEVPGEDLPS